MLFSTKESVFNDEIVRGYTIICDSTVLFLYYRQRYWVFESLKQAIKHFRNFLRQSKFMKINIQIMQAKICVLAYRLKNHGCYTHY